MSKNLPKPIDTNSNIDTNSSPISKKLAPKALYRSPFKQNPEAAFVSILIIALFLVIHAPSGLIAIGAAFLDYYNLSSCSNYNIGNNIYLIATATAVWLLRMSTVSGFPVAGIGCALLFHKTHQLYIKPHYTPTDARSYESNSRDAEPAITAQTPVISNKRNFPQSIIL